MGPAISSKPIDSIGRMEIVEGTRSWAGLPGLRFRGPELILGDLKRFKGDLARFEIEAFRASASKPLVFVIGNQLRNETGKAGDTFSKQPRSMFRRLLTAVCKPISDVIQTSSAKLRRRFRSRFGAK